jgi:hypothetical protein
LINEIDAPNGAMPIPVADAPDGGSVPGGGGGTVPGGGDVGGSVVPGGVVGGGSVLVGGRPGSVVPLVEPTL